MAENDQSDLTTLTVDLLSAYVANNIVASEDLAGLIQSTRAALEGKPGADAVAVPEFTPAVSIRKSLASREHILSLIDGKPYKTLKRHLTSHGLTVAEYRERYKLPSDYPTVAAAYSDKRRETAARIGLGRKPAKPAAAPAKTAKPTKAPVKAKAAAKPEVAAAPAAATALAKTESKAPKAKAAKPAKKAPAAKAKPAMTAPAAAATAAAPTAEAKAKPAAKPRTLKASFVKDGAAPAAEKPARAKKAVTPVTAAE